DTGTFDASVAIEFARVFIVRRGPSTAPLARFSLTGAVDGKDREPAFEQRIVVHRSVFFAAVHAGNVHHARNLLAGSNTGWEMQKGLNEFCSVGKLHTIDPAVGVLDELIIAGAFSFLPGDSFG